MSRPSTSALRRAWMPGTYGVKTRFSLMPGQRSTPALPWYAMRLRIAHSTSYRYEPPATGVIQILRMTPGSHDGQYVAEWHVDVSTDSRLDTHEDAFGNVTHVLTHRPISALPTPVVGLLATRD